PGEMESAEAARKQAFPEAYALLRAATPRVWATPAIAALLIVCFVGSVLLGVDPISPTAAQLLRAGGSFGPALLGGQWWRLLTSSLLHAGLVHLGFNLWVFWSGGLLAERVFGPAGFLAIYVLSALGSAVLSVTVKPLAVAIGASGAVFGVYGALLIFVLGHHGPLPRDFLLKQRSSLLGLLGLNLVYSVLSTQVDLWGHLGGFLTGLIAGWLLRRDLLQPSVGQRRRLAGTVSLAVVLLVGSWAARERVARMPEIRDELCTDAARESGKDTARIEAAIDMCSRAVKTSKNPAAPRTQRVWLRLKQGNVSQAMHELDEILTDSPDHAPARQLRAAIFLDRHRDDEAARDCAKLDEAKREDYRPNATCSEVAMARGDAARAVQRASLVLEQRPDHEDALRVRARARQIQGDPTGAIADLDAVLRLKPSDASALNDRGWLRIARNDFAGGREDAEKSLVAQPGSAPALGTRCFALVGLGDLQGARGDCTASLQHRPRDSIQLGMIAFLDGKRDEAVRLWKRAAEDDPAEAAALEPWILKAGGR
ncbi:MAG TPA: rhomboid family intramembrane serine protease, partial [Myxococcaceae bacterium]|nr:rhomboid family intramembrane serine protease [Myxococcaceae bacterium]